jgi:uncharacterized protein with HEPN domain
MDKEPTVFLQHIRDSLSQIESYVAGYSYEQFLKDKKTQDAVIRQLEMIGEATTNLASTFKESHPNIPWREIADFRNVLAHEYWDVDIEIVWNAIQEDLSTLKNSLIPLVANN